MLGLSGEYEDSDEDNDLEDIVSRCPEDEHRHHIGPRECKAVVRTINRLTRDFILYSAPPDARKQCEVHPRLADLHPNPNLCSCIEDARRSMLELVTIGTPSPHRSRSSSTASLEHNHNHNHSHSHSARSTPTRSPGRLVFVDDDDGGAALGSMPSPSHYSTIPSLEEELDEHDSLSLLLSYPKSVGLASVEADALLQEFGANCLPEKVTPKWLVFARLLIEPMPIVIWLSCIVELSLGNYLDFAILFLINVINASLSFYELSKAGDAVNSLKASMQPKAAVFRDGVWHHDFDATRLVPGDLIELAAGKAVPADVMINEGAIDIDESAMTGETLPVPVRERQMAKMGSTVVRGECEATVILTGANTFFGKTAAMLGSSSSGDDKSNLQKLLLKIMLALVVAPLLLAAASLAYILVSGRSLSEALNFAVVLVVSSAPLAMEIVTTTTLALGSRQLSAFGAIVSRLTAIEDLAGLNMLCSDKTGTLTKNKMEIQDEAPVFVEPPPTQLELLRYAAMAARWDSPPKDALDTLVLRCQLWDPSAQTDEQLADALTSALSDVERLDHLPFDPEIKRTESTVRWRTSMQIRKVTKGAPHIIAALDDDEHKRNLVEAKVRELGEDGIRCMAIAVSEPLGATDEPVVWRLLGLLTFLDPPRSDTRATIERAQELGVPVRMITGDHALIARNTCRALNLGDQTRTNWPAIGGPAELPRLGDDGKPPEDLVDRFGPTISNADGFAQVWPEHKFLIVECYRRLGYKCGMTGDGVNDAPALKVADVGIAVAGATEAAQAAADIILTQEGLGTIVQAIHIARVIFRRMKSFLTYRIAVSLYILLVLFLALLVFNPSHFSPALATETEQWPDLFQIPVLFLIILTVLNDGCIITIGYDHAKASQLPDRWHLPSLAIAAFALAVPAVLGSLGAIALLLHFAPSPDNAEELPRYGHVVTGAFLQIAITAFLTLFSARTQGSPFFRNLPHFGLLIAGGVALSTATLIALFWPEATIDEIPVCGLAYFGQGIFALYIWLYSACLFLVQDAIKVATFFLLKKSRFGLADPVEVIE